LIPKNIITWIKFKEIAQKTLTKQESTLRRKRVNKRIAMLTIVSRAR
jgi:hypothetical protein